MSRFCCPKCGHDTAEEIVMDAVLYNEVLGLSEDGAYLAYGDYDINDGCVAHYRCAKCGWNVPGVNSVDDMCNWIKENGKEVKDEKGA